MNAKFKTLSLALLTAGAMAAGSAYALPSVTSKFVPGPNTWSDDSAEVLIDNPLGGGTAGVLDVGDYLVGMIKITSWPTAADNSAATANEFTAIFVTELLSVTDLADEATNPAAGIINSAACGQAGMSSCSALSFGAASAGFNTIWTSLGFAPFTNSDGSLLDANAAVVILEDTNHDFIRETAANPLLAFASAADGDERMVLGLTSPGDKWNGIAPVNFSEIALQTPGGATGSFVLDLTILNEGFAGWDFDPDIVGSGTVQRPTTGSSFEGLGFYDDTTVSVNITRVPEPATLGLLGLGLLGLGMARRKAA